MATTTFTLRTHLTRDLLTLAQLAVAKDYIVSWCHVSLPYV